MSRAGVIDIIEGKEGFVPTFLRALFYVMSLAFRMVRKVVGWSLDVGVIKRGSVDIPVVSVGNIVAGGTGKTPLIEFLGKEIEGAAVVSRGYRSKYERGNAKVDPKGSSIDFGDEPLMLAKKFPVFIGKNRFFSAKRAEEEGAKAILLDDGMQQRWLKADLQIGVVRGSDPFGKGHFLPRGYLRDAPEKLSGVDLVVMNGDGDVSALKKYTKAPVAVVKPKPLGAENAKGEAISLEGKRVGIFCAIGNPESFRATIEEMGGEVVAEMHDIDHAPFSEEQLEKFQAEIDADFLVCTEKDWIKIKNPKNEWLFVRIELTVVSGNEEIQHFLSQVRQLSAKKVGGNT